jgi:hypothetical protein
MSINIGDPEHAVINTLQHDYDQVTAINAFEGTNPQTFTTYNNFKRTSCGMKQGKHFAFTIHCHSLAHAKMVMSIMQDSMNENLECIDLAVCGLEKCPTSGNYHLQCYLSLKRKRRIAIIFRNFIGVWKCNVWPWIKHAIASAWHNKKYCEKDGESWCLGEMAEAAEEVLKKLGGRGQGKRTDIESCVEAIRKDPWKKKLYHARENAKQFFNFNRAFNEYLKLERDEAYHKGFATSDRATDMNNHNYYGGPGTGKSYEIEQAVKRLIEANPSLRVYYKTVNKWWDGYDGEEIVVIDDYRSSMPFSELLNLLDGKPFRREAKGSCICLRANHIFISTPKHPRYWYKKLMEEDGDAEGQLLRRFVCVREFTPQDNPRYNHLVRSRIQQRNRMGFVVAGGAVPGEQRVLAPVHFDRPLFRTNSEIAVRNRKRKTTSSGKENYDGHGGHFPRRMTDCLICTSGMPCYIHGSNLDPTEYDEEDILETHINKKKKKDE